MTLHTYSNAPDFLADVQEFLERNEDVNSLTLGVAGRLKPDDTSAYLATVRSDGAITTVALMTPPYRLQIVAEEISGEAVELIAHDVHNRRGNISGVMGRTPVSLALAEAFASVAGIPFSEGKRLRLYRLDEVMPPPSTPGTFRQATEADLDLVAEWCAAFDREAVPNDPPRDQRALVEQKIAAGEIFLWEDGNPVSMAARARPTRTSTTVNLVYTPPELRGRGYASACVAALSQYLLDNGRLCVLFTDLANPTSNKIYQHIGYRPVCDFAEYRFDS